jgi:hypothetical protein
MQKGCMFFQKKSTKNYYAKSMLGRIIVKIYIISDNERTEKDKLIDKISLKRNG